MPILARWGIFPGDRRRLKIPLVVTFHGYDAALKLAPEQNHPSLGQQLNQLLYHRGTFYRRRYVEQRSRLFAQADQIIAVSHCIRSHLLAQGCPAEKVMVHYVGIDRQQFQPDPQVAREPVVLFVGRLVEKKGCGLLLQAMRSIQQLHPQVKTVIIGDGPLRASLEQQAARMLPTHTEFLGVQPAAVVRQWMNRARVFCVPSQMTAQQDVEGLGMVFAEAQAMGLPVVSFASGGVPEVVREGVTGLLAPEGDGEALGKALHRLLDDDALWERLAIAGQHHIAENFDLARNTPLLEAIYDRLLDRKSHDIG
ncbi:MAG: glycosyltransferase [Synechococcales cyanobacterium RU_4_20]|nr:glycosyltransferase [Synechococcales cyanobacterium RU_4_20]